MKRKEKQHNELDFLLALEHPELRKWGAFLLFHQFLPFCAATVQFIPAIISLSSLSTCYFVSRFLPVASKQIMRIQIRERYFLYKVDSLLSLPNPNISFPVSKWVVYRRSFHCPFCCLYSLCTICSVNVHLCSQLVKTGSLLLNIFVLRYCRSPYFSVFVKIFRTRELSLKWILTSSFAFTFVFIMWFLIREQFLFVFHCFYL